MKYEIYLDVIFLHSFAINLFIVLLLKTVIRENVSLIRLILAAIIQTVFDLTVFIFRTKEIFLIIGKEISGVVYIIIFMCTTWLSLLVMLKNKDRIKQALNLYVCLEILLSGIANLLVRIMGYQSYFIFMALNITILGIIVWSQKMNQKKAEYEHTICFSLRNREFKFTGYVDSGNLLRLPISNKAVLIGDNKVLMTVFSDGYTDFVKKYMENGNIDYEMMAKMNSQFTVFPVIYKCINGKNNVMPTIMLGEVNVDGDKVYRNVPLCFSNCEIDGKYDILLPLEFCK